MIITVTSIRLRSFWNFFALSYNAMQIMKQMKSQGGVLAFRKTGFGYTHYTLSAWSDESTMKSFVRTGAHLNAMKKSSAMSTEIRTYTYQADAMPSWKDAKRLLLEKGKLLSFTS